MATTDFLKILQTLTKHEVKFVVVGAMSAALQGAQISTFDIDIVHERSVENIGHLVDALTELDAIYRGHPARLSASPEALAGVGHQLLMTRSGPLDILGQIEDALDFDAIGEFCVEKSVADLTLTLLSLEHYLRIRRKYPRERDVNRFALMEAALARLRGER